MATIHVPVDLDVKLVHLLVVLVVLGQPPGVAQRPPGDDVCARQVFEPSSAFTAPHVTAGVAVGNGHIIVESRQSCAAACVARMAVRALGDSGLYYSPRWRAGALLTQVGPPLDATNPALGVAIWIERLPVPCGAFR